MLTAITHHRFDSQVWGEDEVRKLHLELTEIDMLTTQVAVEHAAARARRRLARAFLARARTVKGWRSGLIRSGSRGLLSEVR
jgi:hypothetical protein